MYVLIRASEKNILCHYVSTATLKFCDLEHNAIHDEKCIDINLFAMSFFAIRYYILEDKAALFYLRR